jgi:hypothetical protein
MYIDDLTPMIDRNGQAMPKIVAIGWLDRGHEFSVGQTPLDFRDVLRRLCEQPVRRTRGFHNCPFCTGEQVRGNGEIDVLGQDRRVFVAPSMVSHYVDRHSYRPPEAFVQAVRLGAGLAADTRGYTLSNLISAMADNPVSSNRDDFYRIFLSSRVGARVSAEAASLPAGARLTTHGTGLCVPTAVSPTGETMLVVLADVGELSIRENRGTFFELDSVDVLRLAGQYNAGIVVHSSLPGRGAWVGIPAADVRQLLFRKRSGTPKAEKK